MAESSIAKVTPYASVIDTNKFIDYAIQLGILDKKAYCDIWFLSEKQQLKEIFKKIAEKGSQYINIVHQKLMHDFPNINQIKEDDYNFNKCLMQGYIPKLPLFYYINREPLTSKLRRSLETLRFGESLVVCGMVGYGKTCLVSAALQDKFLVRHFNFHVFWIDFEKNTLDENFILLYNRVCESFNLPISSGCPKDNLRKLFQSSNNIKNALLVLDNVNDKSVLPLFDFGWKRVIITQCKDFIEKCDYYIEVDRGFIWKDVLKMFKMSLNTNEIFEEEAFQIYNLCSGHPMIINMICQYLWKNKHSKKNIQFWQNIVDKLVSGNYNLDSQGTYLNDINNRLSLSIDQLVSPTLKSKFMDLAIFPIDANIPLTVLQILWNLPECNVRNIMNIFCGNSLVIQFYYERESKYFYAIHKVLSHYLKSIMKLELKTIHQKLIDGYIRVTKCQFHLLPDDNYSFFFIGYHLIYAGRVNLFVMFTGPLFLEAYIKKAGKLRVLADMEMFERFIGKKHIEAFNDLKNAVKKYGSILYNFPNTTIMQIALQNSISDIWKMLQYNNLYFHFLCLLDEDGINDYHKIISSDNISCAAFATCDNYILVGFCSGLIKLFYREQRKEIYTFKGHSSSVKKIIVSPDKKYFLSISHDSLIIWKVPFKNKPYTEGVISVISYEPQVQQPNWKDFFIPDNTKFYYPWKTIKSEANDLVTAAFYEEFSKWPYIATGSKQGCCSIFDIRTGMKAIESLDVGSELTCVCFTRNKLIFSYGASIQIRGVTVANGKLSYNECLIQLFNKRVVIDFFYSKQYMLVVSEECIDMWNLNFSDSCNQLSYRYKPKRGFKNKRPVSSVLTKDAKYLMLNIDIGVVYVWDVVKKEIVTEYKTEGNVLSMDIYCNENNTDHILLVSSDRNMLQRYFVCPENFKGGISDVFLMTSQAYWKKNQLYVLFISSDNRIRVYRSFSLISETETINSKITCMCFSICGDCVIYGLENGEVSVFNIKERSYHMLNSIDNRGPIRSIDCVDMAHLHDCVDNMNNAIDCDPNSNSDGAKFSGLVIAICDQYLSFHSSFAPHSIPECFNAPICLQKNPTLFYMKAGFFLVDQYCNIFMSNIKEKHNGIMTIRGYNKTTVRVNAVAFCTSMEYLVLAVLRNMQYFLDLIHVNEEGAVLIDSWEIEYEATCCAISHDGVLIAAGSDNGQILVWDVIQRKEHFLPRYQNDSVSYLLFSPGLNFILISLSSVVTVWDLQLFTGSSKSLSMDKYTLTTTQPDMLMDQQSWSSRIPYRDGCLLAYLRFHAKPIYLSHSKDFTTFLVIDANNNIHIFKF